MRVSIREIKLAALVAATGRVAVGLAENFANAYGELDIRKDILANMRAAGLPGCIVDNSGLRSVRRGLRYDSPSTKSYTRWALYSRTEADEFLSWMGASDYNSLCPWVEFENKTQQGHPVKMRLSRTRLLFIQYVAYIAG